jgi:tetratricopeptide (TPR) repeat protein
LQSSLEISRHIENKAGTADTLGELSKLLLNAGRIPEAIAAITEALAIYEQLGWPDKIGKALSILGAVYEEQDEYEAALEKYQQAFEMAQQYGSPQEQAAVERRIAQVQAKLRETG